jgi:hypothetical protein
VIYITHFLPFLPSANFINCQNDHVLTCKEEKSKCLSQTLKIKIIYMESTHIFRSYIIYQERFIQILLLTCRNKQSSIIGHQHDAIRHSTLLAHLRYSWLKKDNALHISIDVQTYSKVTSLIALLCHSNILLKVILSVFLERKSVTCSTSQCYRLNKNAALQADTLRLHNVLRSQKRTSSRLSCQPTSGNDGHFRHITTCTE